MLAQNWEETLSRYGQQDLIGYLLQADETVRSAILKQLERVDLEEYFSALSSLETTAVPQEAIGEPYPTLCLKGLDTEHFAAIGKEILQEGRLGFLLVAGGQGTRLGFPHPKGMYPVGVVSKRSLFEIHFHKALCCGRYYGFEPHFFLMTSSINREETERFLEAHAFFGFSRDQVHVFEQGELPAVDPEHRLILEDRDRLFRAPDGHGGVLKALHHSGMLARMHRQKIEYLSYFQVDNPLVEICDPVFLGAHCERKAEISSKVLAKRHPLEKIGIPVVRGDRAAIVEYSDLPESLARKTASDGSLYYNYGSIAIHLLNVDFIARIASGVLRLPYHKAMKRIPYYDPHVGKTVHPSEPNGKKLERFVFDAIPLARQALFMECSRSQEFAPLKNKEGEDSVATCHAGQSAKFREWFSRAGFDTTGLTTLEISPFYACCWEEFRHKVSIFPPALREGLYLE